MAHVAWKLHDDSTGSRVTLQFAVNPKEAEYPGRSANITEESGTSPSSNLILFQGRDSAQRMSTSGSIRTEAFYTDLVAWGNKWYPLVLEDDLGNTFNVIVQSMKLTRLRKVNAPWRFDVDFEFMVV